MTQKSRTGKIVGGCCGLLTALGVIAMLAVVVFTFTSCGFNRYIVGAGLPQPDSAFQTGTVVGYNVYIWECYQDKRIVLYNPTSEMWIGPFKREEVKCGEKTPIELQLANEKQIRTFDPKNFW